MQKQLIISDLQTAHFTSPALLTDPDHFGSPQDDLWSLGALLFYVETHGKYIYGFKTLSEMNHEHFT
jgi:serine/threonine protein kinase